MGRLGRTVGLLVGLMLAFSASAAHAATITVTTTTDELVADGHCSLREAVIASNTDTSGPGGDCTPGSGADTVGLAGGAPYKLTIAPVVDDDATTGDLNLTQPVTISGASAASTTIDGGGIDRIFDVGASGVEITGVTITDGHPGNNQSGGGIVVASAAASLTLTNSIVTGNQAHEGGGLDAIGASLTISDSAIDHNTSASGGGGIFTGSPTSITRTQISNNAAPRGAGLWDNVASLTISDSSVSDNGDATTADGGGLEIDGGPAALTDVQVTGNTANNVGGGIYSDARSAEATTLARTVVAGNSVAPPAVSPSNQVFGGGIYATGALNLVDSWVHDNSAVGGSGSGAGGIFFQPRNPDEQLQIQGSTIGPSNRSNNADGIALTSTSSINPASATLVRSTVAGNGDDLEFGVGGGIYVGAYVTADLRDDTLAENKASNSTGGGNLYAMNTATVKWQNTLVARPFGGGNCDHGTSATMTTLGGNQEYGDPNALCGFQIGSGDTVSATDLDTTQLGELKDSGGPTETMALLPGAPPVDTGSGCQPTDQRGVPRPQGSACDSGAYELDTTAPTTTITSGPSGTTTNNPVRFTFTADEPASFECQLDNGGFSPCSSPFTSGPLSLGPHTFSVRATDIAGHTGAPASRAFTVAPGGSGPGGDGSGSGSDGGGAGGSLPRITSARESARAWREGKALPEISRARTPVGTTFSLTLDEPALTVFTFKRTAPGRRVGRRCLAATGANQLRPHCRRLVPAGTIRVQAHAGLNRVRFAGRLNRKRRLAPGSYALILTAVANRITSTPVTLRFRILRG